MIVVALEGAKGMNTVLDLSDFLVRPFNEEEFRRSARNVLSQSRGRIDARRC